jgi:hypothetical protein
MVLNRSGGVQTVGGLWLRTMRSFE